MNLQLTYSVAGQGTQTVPLKNFPLIIGSLASNQIFIRGAGIDPIHALLEEEDGQIFLTDLGSASGVFRNGEKINVQTEIFAGDSIQLGSVTLKVDEQRPGVLGAVPPPSTLPLAPQSKSTPIPPITRDRPLTAPPRDLPASSKPAVPETQNPNENKTDAPSASTFERRTQKTQTDPAARDRRQENKELLFSPRKARPSGDTLECVAYWDDTVLDVDLFHPTFKDYNKVTIGNPTKAHFISAGDADIEMHVLATVDANGYKVRLLDGMKARMRKGGQVESVEGPGSHYMGPRDIVHITYGPIKYFLLFVRPPQIDLPRAKNRDPLLSMLITGAALIYLSVIPMLWLATPKPEEEPDDDVVALVQLPKKEEPPKTPPPPPKPVVKVEEVKQEVAKKTPPPPPPKPIKAAKPIEVETPKQQKPVENPVAKQEKSDASENLKRQVVAPKPQEAKQAGNDAKPDPNKNQGMASTGAKNPDFKKPGPPNNNPSPKSGGAQGGGMNQAGGERKGNQAASVHGVEGPKNNQASGVNLSKLGLGVGKILNETGPGAIATNFKSSAGGAGGGSGSGSKNYGLGGVGNSGSLGLAGAGSAVNNFGSGSGGFGGGQGGTGGLGGAGIGKGFGEGDSRGRANVSVPAAGPEVSGGLSRQEILAVIQANLNQIRHCYEQLLQRSPNASGKITVDFTIGASGDVTSARISEGSISDSIMRGCVTGRVERWNFPKPRGAASVDVKYPFVFTPL